MDQGVFIIGVCIIAITALGVAISPRREMALVAGIGAGTLAILVAWLLLFRLLFGLAA